MYHATQYLIRPHHDLYEYCQKMCSLANNMYNVSLYYMRQVMTAMDKLAKGEELQHNEAAVLDEIETYLPAMNARRKKGKPFEMPTPQKKLVGNQFLDMLFRVSENTDYMSGLPKQATQHIIKQAEHDMIGFFATLRSYKRNPGAFSGKPNPPDYKKSGGMCELDLSNQDAKVYGNELKLPVTKLRLSLGSIVQGELKTVQIKPYCGIFKIILICDDGIHEPAVHTEAVRIAAIDFGVSNIAAVANNVGLPGLLFKGGVIKAENQWFNKKRASIMHGITVGHEKVAKRNCHSLDRLTIHRDGFMRTHMHTISNRIIDWCIANNIDTLVLGQNKHWKQEVNIGAENNQSFVSVPFYQLQEYLRYKGARRGIQVVDREESYTSKASFLDMDDIPTYSKEYHEEYHFSGRRTKRGLYKAKDGTIVNADLNGAGNILRKAYPDAFLSGAQHRFLTEIITM